MYFELTDALIDHILFCMEDQQGDFLLDAQEGIIINLKLDPSFPEAQDRYWKIPEWDSAQGFYLMERFTAGLKNPQVQRELTAALDQGKGVFRAFKNILNRREYIEKQWFAFKEREMKRKIILWYNSLRDLWGLERIGTEPEETEDLVLEDFMFREPKAADQDAAAELHRRILEEQEPPCSLELPGDLAWIAETSSGEFAAALATLQKDTILYITALEVKPEFRGLGIGEALCSRLLERIPPEVSQVILELPAPAEGFSQVLLRKRFKPCATRYSLNLKTP